ncbi:hypothetical protein BABINDRAFT_159020 [Babjeviella inositovora NRRL Y-12698]|uniref:Short-chain dehydrogenase/reductase 3 n=1 Tax=Babjeviella inositovora NRRL Y-12698 TaxID=984486 RepID=A0A1E3QXM9_9ASCO|nr:uncharacterized protein BABINDRAFT_159020 [Babjeviella inositovora NRRL Y-12698]ODQ82425.1 hypothetical protein BABINDRAFT_159020 [Babjeviella inositovora NRRL Y-12698]
MGAVLLTVLFYYLNKQYREIADNLIGTYYEPHRDIVLVTGGSGGLGREIVSKFSAAEGSRVVVLDINVPLQADKIPGVYYYKCDVSNRREVLKVSSVVKKEVGIVSILINNAGITFGKTLVDLSFDEIESTIQINLLSSFYTIKAFLPNMLEHKRGYIVTVASALGYMSPARLSAYGASKSGLIALHESLTYELGPPSVSPKGVKMLLICPGQLQTRMFEGVHTPSTSLAPELKPEYVAKTIFNAVELGRRGEIRIPFYANILPIFRAAPWPVVEVTRRLSGIDRSMTEFVGRAKSLKDNLSLSSKRSSNNSKESLNSNSEAGSVFLGQPIDIISNSLLHQGMVLK